MTEGVNGDTELGGVSFTISATIVTPTVALAMVFMVFSVIT